MKGLVKKMTEKIFGSKNIFREDEYIRPEEIKADQPIWIKAFIDNDIVHPDAQPRIRVHGYCGHEDSIFYLPQSQIKIRRINT
jgi:hypothetical protein